MKSDGFFLVLEGADGCGKTTVMRELIPLLSATNKQVRRVNRGVCSGIDPLSDIVHAVRALFESVDNQRVPQSLLGISAAAQYSALLQSQVIPFLNVGDIIVADSWWNKTRARLVIEAELCGMPANQVIELDQWLRKLMPPILMPSERQLSVVIETPQEDRAGWYALSDDREIVYDESGSDSYDPAVYASLTTRLQNMLLIDAAHEGWPVVQNSAQRTPYEVAAEIFELANSRGVISQ